MSKLKLSQQLMLLKDKNLNLFSMDSPTNQMKILSVSLTNLEFPSSFCSWPQRRKHLRTGGAKRTRLKSSPRTNSRFLRPMEKLTKREELISPHNMNLMPEESISSILQLTNHLRLPWRKLTTNSYPRLSLWTMRKSLMLTHSVLILP